MKKITVLIATIAVALFAANGSFAQTSKGDFKFSGTTQANLSVATSGGSGRASNFILDTGFEHFVVDNFSLGIDLGASFVTVANTESNYNVSIQPFLGYYFNRGQRFIPYVKAGAGYMRTEAMDNAIGGVVGSLDIGGDYILGNNVALNFGVTGSVWRAKAGDISATAGIVNPYIGFSIFF